MTNPVLREKLITKEYWDCGNPSHTHRDRSVAVRCMSSRTRHKDPLDSLRRERVSQVIRILNGGTVNKEADAGGTTSRAVVNAFRRTLRRVFLKAREIDTEVGRSIFSGEHVYSMGITEAREHKTFWIKLLSGELK